MTKKTAVITGAASGIGLEASRILIQKGYQVVMTVRSEQSREETLALMKASEPSFSGDILVMDLSQLDAVRACAESINQKYPVIDVLINNAGLLSPEALLTKDGFELNFGVNYLAPFLFTNLLLDGLKRSDSARIVNVSSMTHKGAKLKPETWRSTDGYKMMAAYRQSKLALTMFTNELARQLESSSVSAVSLHPGAIASNIYKKQPGFVQWLAKVFFTTPVKAAQVLVYAADSAELEGVSGVYLHKTKVSKEDAVARDLQSLQKLWQQTLPLCGLTSQ